MDTYRIIVGFSDIKLELIAKCNLKKSPNELALWFSFDDSVLYVHDMSDHEKCKVVALDEDAIFKIYLNPKLNGWPLVQYAHQKTDKDETVANVLNDLFDSYGFLPTR